MKKSQINFPIKSNCLTLSEPGIQNFFRDSWAIALHPNHKVNFPSWLYLYLWYFKPLNKMRCQKDSDTKHFFTANTCTNSQTSGIFSNLFQRAKNKKWSWKWLVSGWIKLYSSCVFHFIHVSCCPQPHNKIHYAFLGTEEQMVFLLDETNRDSAILTWLKVGMLFPPFKTTTTFPL